MRAIKHWYLGFLMKLQYSHVFNNNKSDTCQQHKKFQRPQNILNHLIEQLKNYALFQA